jgi:hypothetical protein
VALVKVDEVRLSHVRVAVLDEDEVLRVHAEVRDAVLRLI